MICIYIYIHVRYIHMYIFIYNIFVSSSPPIALYFSPVPPTDAHQRIPLVNSCPIIIMVLALDGIYEQNMQYVVLSLA
jgi:hypothetical protein